MKKIKIGLAVMAAALAFLIVAGCTVPEVVTNPDGSQSTNMVVDPKLTSGIEIGGAINTATAPVNPFWPVVSAGLAAIAAVATAVAKVQNTQKSNAVLQKENVTAQLRSVVIAVDDLDDAKVKQAIQAQAINDGTEASLRSTVKSVGVGRI